MTRARHRGEPLGAAAAAKALDRSPLLLGGPIAATLLKLAAPTLVVVMMQAAINVIETYFVGRLGTDALAGVSLVFPLLMLMTMMSAGGMGGAVASAVARALGGGRRDDAEAILVHALIIALALGVVFSIAAIVAAPRLYGAMGGAGGALSAAIRYSNTIFAGAVAFWLLNVLAAVLRGTGNMVFPALVSVAGAVVLIPLSPALILGWGPFPRLGVAGGATALVAYYVAGAATLLAYILLGRNILRLHLRGIRLRAKTFGQILGVGAISSVMTVQSNLMVIVTTGLVGLFGTAALAGYGLAARLDYLLIPPVFALGTAAVTMVGTNIGAGQIARAERIAWVAAAIAFGVCALIGAIVSIVPSAWLGLFSSDAAVLRFGGLYLRIVGPFYGFIGAALLLFFASQGAGQMRWPFIGGLLRFLIVIVIGGAVVRVFGAGLPALFAVIALSAVTFGTVNALGIGSGAWRQLRAPSPVSLARG
jgi:putative MATE family efflux protein